MFELAFFWFYGSDSILMISGLLVQLQIFWQFCRIDLLGLLTGLGLHELQHFKAFGRIWHADLLQELGFVCNFKVEFEFIYSFLSSRRFWLGLGEKSSLCSCWFSSRLNSPSYSSHKTCFCFCYLCLATDRVSFGTWIWHNMRDWGWCDRERLVDFVAGKTQLVSCYHWNNFDAIDVKMDVSVFDGKLLLILHK